MTGHPAQQVYKVNTLAGIGFIIYEITKNIAGSHLFFHEAMNSHYHVLSRSHPVYYRPYSNPIHLTRQAHLPKLSDI